MSVRAAAAAAIRAARRRLEPGPRDLEDLRDLARVADLVAATPGLAAAVDAMAGAPIGSPAEDDAAAEILRLLAPARVLPAEGPWPVALYPVPTPVDPELLETARRMAAAAAQAPPGEPTEAELAALREALMQFLARRGHRVRDLPGETRHLLMAGLVPALAAAAPGAPFPDRAADDFVGPAHAAWRHAHPAAAAALDRLWDLRPDGAPFHALLRETLDPALGPF